MIVIEAVSQTEVFANQGGGVTICQKDCGEDVLIFIPAASVNVLCAALKRAAKESLEA